VVVFVKDFEHGRGKYDWGMYDFGIYSWGMYDLRMGFGSARWDGCPQISQMSADFFSCALRKLARSAGNLRSILHAAAEALA